MPKRKDKQMSVEEDDRLKFRWRDLDKRDLKGQK